MWSASSPTSITPITPLGGGREQVREERGEKGGDNCDRGVMQTREGDKQEARGENRETKGKGSKKKRREVGGGK
jgi:hypothetical protein